MERKERLQELEDQIIKGLEEAYRKMVLFKRQQKSPVIGSKDGKVVEIDPDKIRPTTSYKR